MGVSKERKRLRAQFWRNLMNLLLLSVLLWLELWAWRGNFLWVKDFLLSRNWLVLVSAESGICSISLILWRILLAALGSLRDSSTLYGLCFEFKSWVTSSLKLLFVELVISLTQFSLNYLLFLQDDIFVVMGFLSFVEFSVFLSKFWWRYAAIEMLKTRLYYFGIQRFWCI